MISTIPWQPGSTPQWSSDPDCRFLQECHRSIHGPGYRRAAARAQDIAISRRFVTDHARVVALTHSLALRAAERRAVTETQQ